MDEILLKSYFENLGNALNRLQETLSLPELNQIDHFQDAAIQRFEFSFELYWKVLKKLLDFYEKNRNKESSRSFTGSFSSWTHRR